jgi:glyoxylate carboligase
MTPSCQTNWRALAEDVILTAFRLPPTVSRIPSPSERWDITNVSMGTEIDNVVEFEELDEVSHPVPTASGPRRD